MDAKQIKRLERVFKGVSNHWRIRILLCISDSPGITLEGIVEKLKSNYQTTSEHVRRLTTAGLITKKYRGKAVSHDLSPYGEKMLKQFKSFLV